MLVLVLCSGCVPDLFSMSMLVEKGTMGDLFYLDNYRLISLVNMFSKVFESCLSKWLKMEKYVKPLLFCFDF